MIIDVSHHQDPADMDYDKLAQQVNWAIVRTQYGLAVEDRHYKTHHAEFKKRGTPTAAYAWVRGSSIEEMEEEATEFYRRSNELNPTFYFLDVEEKSMEDMRAGVSTYMRRLRELGAEKVGIYIAHHRYGEFNLNLEEADAVWIPHYGKNNGQITSRPLYPCDIHQYTSKGRLDGYDNDLDLNRLLSNKPLSYYIENAEVRVSGWAKEAWDWAIENEISFGERPGEVATREEVVTMLYRFSQKING